METVDAAVEKRAVTGKALVAVIVALLLIVGPASSAADASSDPQAFGRSGATGKWHWHNPVAECVYPSWSMRRDIYTYSPAVWAAPGAADGQWVRFRSFLYNPHTDAFEAANGWSAYIRAYHDRATTWSGSQTFVTNGNGSRRVVMQIEWYAPSGSYLGTIALEGRSYRSWNVPGSHQPHIWSTHGC